MGSELVDFFKWTREGSNGEKSFIIYMTARQYLQLIYIRIIIRQDLIPGFAIYYQIINLLEAVDYSRWNAVAFGVCVFVKDLWYDLSDFYPNNADVPKVFVQKGSLITQQL